MPKRLNKTDLRMKKFAHLHAASNFENATQAAIGAGYSKKSAHSIASRLLNNVKVQRFLVEVAEKAIKPLEIKQDDILRRLKAVAFANIADVMEFVELDGQQYLQIKRLDQLPREISCTIESIKIRRERIVYEGGMKVHVQIMEVKLQDRGKALENLARWAGLYKQVTPDEVYEFFAGLQIITPGVKNDLPGKTLNKDQKRLGH